LRSAKLMCRGALAAGALSFVLLVPASGSAAKSKTIGSDLQGTPAPSSGFGCGPAPCAIQQLKLPGEPNRTRVPFKKGVIRKWRFRTDHPGSDYDLRLYVVRKVDGDFRFVRRSAPEHIGPEAGTYVFRARLRVKRGDFIALELPADGEVLGPARAFYVAHDGALDHEWFPTPSLGSIASPDSPESDTEYFYNATVKKKKKKRR
jgi:hypothetical protein